MAESSKYERIESGDFVPLLAVTLFVLVFAPLISELSLYLPPEITEPLLFMAFIGGTVIATALLLAVVQISHEVFAALAIAGPIVGFSLMATAQGGTVLHPAPIFVGILFGIGHLGGLGVYILIERRR